MTLVWFLAFLVTLEHTFTMQEQARGLMYRTELPEKHGMTFSYPREKKRTFWSQNCLIDLDLLFLNKEHTIIEKYRLEACPTMSITSKKPARFVVEFAAGFCDKYHVEIGDRILWDPKETTGEIIQQKPIDDQRVQSAALHLFR